MGVNRKYIRLHSTPQTGIPTAIRQWPSDLSTTARQQNSSAACWQLWKSESCQPAVSGPLSSIWSPARLLFKKMIIIMNFILIMLESLSLGTPICKFVECGMHIRIHMSFALSIIKFNLQHMLHECLPYTSATIVPAKSDSDVILCLQLLSKILTCTLHLS